MPPSPENDSPSVQRPDIRFDQGRHHRAKIGYVLLATEQTIEDDVMALRPPRRRHSFRPCAHIGQHHQCHPGRPG